MSAFTHVCMHMSQDKWFRVLQSMVVMNWEGAFHHFITFSCFSIFLFFVNISFYGVYHSMGVDSLGVVSYCPYMVGI